MVAVITIIFSVEITNQTSEKRFKINLFPLSSLQGVYAHIFSAFLHHIFFKPMMDN